MSTTSLTRRQFIQRSTAAAAWTATAPAVLTRQVRKPNLLMLMDDQHRGDALGADGNPAVLTPHLDRLAEEGACFHRAYSSTPSCTPARAALLTGRSPWGHGMLGYHRIAPEYPVEMPRALREGGYYTTGIGKMHFHPQRNTHGYHRTILDESGRVESEGFRSDYRSWLASIDPLADPDATGIDWNSYRAGTYVLPETYHPTRWTGDTALQFLEHYDDDAPFFLKVSFARPHSPYDPPKRFMDLYAEAPLPAAHVGPWSEARYGHFTDPLPYTLARGNLGPAQVWESRQGYYGNITFIDEQVGRILDALTRRGLLDNTLILFFSDHGDMVGDHHLWRKTYAYEGSARVPFLVRWPEGMLDAPRGQHRYEPVELRDVLPTFLDAAGLPTPASVEGASLLPLLSGQADGWRPYLDLEHATTYFPENVWNALTDGRWKYIYHAFDGTQQLFDLNADPGETNDLADDLAYTGLLKQWRQHMVDHLSVRGAPWVVDGDLGLRPDRITLGPNYPTSDA